MKEVRRSARRRWLFWSAMAFMFLGLPGLYVIFLLWDGTRPQDADLLEPAPTITRERNGVFCLSEPEASVDWGDVPGWTQNMAFTADWDPKLAVELLARNAAAIEKLDDALRAPEFRFPTGEEVALSSSREWSRISGLLQIRAHKRLEAGRLREAMEDALRVVRLGERIQTGGGVLVFFLAGMRRRSQGFNTMEELIGRGRPSREESDWLDREIAVPFRWRDGLSATLRAEYRSISRSLDFPNLDSNLSNFDVLGMAGEGPVVTEYLGPILKTRLFWNTELTRRLIADGIRRAIADVNGGSVALSWDLPALWWGPLPAKNYQGKVLCRAFLEAYGNAVAKSFKAEFQPCALRTLLALRRYQIEKGTLPVSLEELVPAYLSEIPSDASGRLVGYDREGKRLFDPRKTGAGPADPVAIEFDPPLRPTANPNAEMETTVEPDPEAQK